MYSLFDSIHQEVSVPIAERFLILEPLVVEARIRQPMPAALARYHDQLTADWGQAIEAYQRSRVPDSSLYVAVSFAYAQLPVGKRFDRLLPAHQPHAALKVSAILLAVIAKWAALPVPYVEAGHRSICLINFPHGIPPLIQTLRTVEWFMQTRTTDQVWLANEQTWQHLCKSDGDG